MSTETEGDAEVLTFQYWSDPMCIWAFVGRSKLDRVLEEFSPHVEVDYRIVPVFGSVPWRFREGSWSASGREGRKQSTCRIAGEHGFDEVTGDVWVCDEPHTSWSCGAAAKAAFLAEDAGETAPGAGARYLMELRNHFFLRNRDICKRAEQLEVAEQVGIAPDCLALRLDDGSALAGLWEDENERADLGVRGSPSYLFDGGRAVLYGNFPFAVLHAVVEELLAGMELGGSEC